MATTTTARRKKKKKNPIVRYFVPFGLKQGSEIGMLIGALLMFIGFFVTQEVQLVGVIIALAASLVGITRGVLIILKHKQDKKSPNFKSGLSLTIFWSVFALVALLGIIFYAV